MAVDDSPRPGVPPASDRRRPAWLTRTLREIGPRWARDIVAAGDETKSLYLPLLQDAPKAGIEIMRDLPYGAHSRQVLDIYRPAGARAAPVLAFVHGGAFVRGSKDTNTQMYGNVLTWFARQGWIGVNIEYRLADDAPYPGGARDVAAACVWMETHIVEHGGDPARVCLLGHSAGGTHAAAYACDPALDHVRRPLAGLVLVSGRLRADVLPANPNAAGVRAYFGDDGSAYEQMSPVTHAARLSVPTFIVNAEFDNPLLDHYGLEFALALARARGHAPLHVTLADHNHVSIMAHFNTPEQLLGEMILDFFAHACS